MLCTVKWVLLFVSFCLARDVSDEELHRLPRLFHLDDYDRCLSQADGLYCVGTFQLTPKKEPNPAYDIMTEHVKQTFSFDRRLLHRGYCLSKRCQSDERNSTLRFEQCVDKTVAKQALSARLKELSYCRTHVERKAKLAELPDLPQRMFIYALYCILFLNIVGTLHDVYGTGKKNKHLMAWSIPANWRSLTAIDDENSTFAPVQSSKVILHCIIIYAHSNLIHIMSYVHNPEYLEKDRHSFVNIIIRNGTSLVQVFMLISNFFTGYNVLATAQRSAITGRVITKWIVKRIFRIAPVYFLLTAYSATLWPRYSDGPLWTPIVEGESQVCRNKFWTHLLFINNIVEPSELCMVQSWAMAAEVQLFLLSVFLTLLLMRLRVRAVPVLGSMFAASCLLNVTLAYFAELVPMVKVVVPEILRAKFRGSKSFFHLHVSPWSNLPACLFGLLIAHIYFEQKNKNSKKTEEIHLNGAVQNAMEGEKSGLVKNGVCGKENGACVKENGVCRKENGACVTENGVCRKENGVCWKENGECSKENGVCSKENGICWKESGACVKENGVCRRENEVSGRENGVCGKKNEEHGMEDRICGKEKEACGMANGVHGNENRDCQNEYVLYVKENGVFIGANGIHAENGIIRRKAKELKSSEVIPNGVKNGENFQNGHSKSNTFEHQNGMVSEDKNKSRNKRAPFLLRYAHCFTIPTLVWWVFAGARIVEVESKAVIALYVGLERLMFSLTFAVQLLQVITIKGPWAQLLSWSGWRVPARLVLSVTMVHWTVNMTIAAGRPLPANFSLLYISVDWLATLFYSYVIAVPLSLLVEFPMKKFGDALVSTF